MSFNNARVAGGFGLYHFTKPIRYNYHHRFLSARSNFCDGDQRCQGKVVKVIEKEFVKGYNQETLKRSELGATGVMYYRLDTETDSATRMMILVD
ncbi:MAG: hypothetical protein R2788_04665 [Saprospiraceae bacterium]